RGTGLELPRARPVRTPCDGVGRDSVTLSPAGRDVAKSSHMKRRAVADDPRPAQRYRLVHGEKGGKGNRLSVAQREMPNRARNERGGAEARRPTPAGTCAGTVTGVGEVIALHTVRIGEDNGREALLVDGVVQSISPDDGLRTGGYWAAMVPSERPRNALIL